MGDEKVLGELTLLGLETLTEGKGAWGGGGGGKESDHDICLARVLSDSQKGTVGGGRLPLSGEDRRNCKGEGGKINPLKGILGDPNTCPIGAKEEVKHFLVEWNCRKKALPPPKSGTLVQTTTGKHAYIR